MRKLAIYALLTLLGTQASAKKPGVDRFVNAMGVRGRLVIRQLEEDRILVQFSTKERTTADTLRGDAMLPVWFHDGSRKVFFGRFGASQYPMLIFAVSDPDRIQDSRVVAYQVTKEAGLIGQKVVPDRAIEHLHTTTTSGGRYDLIAIDPPMGTIHSVSYQEARFADYALAFEKLRVRQWEPSIDGFLEVDEGFMRDKRGRLIETTRFRQMGESAQQKMFLANVTKPEPEAPKVQPVVKAAKLSGASAAR